MDVDQPQPDVLVRAARLDEDVKQLLANPLPETRLQVWQRIESSACAVADALRTRGQVDFHTVLGSTALPVTLASLLQLATLGGNTPSDQSALAVFQLLRLTANLSMDHDENRKKLLEAGVPQLVLKILEGYVDMPRPDSRQPLPLSIPNLRIAKTAIGVLINTSTNYEPVIRHLNSLQAAVTILRLSTAVFPPSSWPAHLSSEDNEEVWKLRSGLVKWAWNVIAELKEESPQTLGTVALPAVMSVLASFIPPFQACTTSGQETLHAELAQTDLEMLEEIAGLLESMTMDIEDVRVSLAKTMVASPRVEVSPPLQTLLDFVEKGEYPSSWSSLPQVDQARMHKAFDLSKAATITAIVEVAGEDQNTEVLWDDSDPAAPGGRFVAAMMQWLKTSILKDGTIARDDLVICATISLANLVRRDKHSQAMIQEPIAVLPILCSLLAPETNFKVKHGAIGLLKHLSQAPANREIMGQAHVIESLARGQIWTEKGDIAEVVQLSSIGVAKNLCIGNAENAIAAVTSDGAEQSAITQILKLTVRSDSVAVKSEGTRVLVNIIKSLWSSQLKADDAARKSAVETITSPISANTLAQLIGRSRKYEILINEGTVALTLMATRPTGAFLAVDAILAPLSSEAPPSSAASASSSDLNSPVTGPSRALDLLLAVLKNDEKRFAPEVRSNVCALLAQLVHASSSRPTELARIKDVVRNPLEVAASASDSLVLNDAARNTLKALT